MACASCRSGKSQTNTAAAKVRPQVHTSIARKATSRTATAKDGAIISLDGPVFSSGRKPTGGWGLTLLYKGLRVRIAQPTAKSVVEQAFAYLKANGSTATLLDIWLNFNLSWADKVNEKYHRLSKADLIALSVPFENGSAVVPAGVKSPTPSNARDYDPSDWGSIAWNFMGVYLASDRYNRATLQAIFQNVVDMLDISKNPSIGCAECYQHASTELAKFKSNPPLTQANAREWLHQFHNSVNERIEKPVITFDDAAKHHLWV